MSNRTPGWLIIPLLLLLLLGTSLTALHLGSVAFSPLEVMAALAGRGEGMIRLTVMELRLPRVLTALLVGGMLALSGTLYQALLRNPLSDPFIIGVSGGAALGATFALVQGMGQPWVAFMALGGSLAVTAAVHLLSLRFALPVSTLLLAGIALNMVCSSLVMLIYAFSDASRVHRALLWLMGDLSGAPKWMLLAAALLLLITASASLLLSRQLDILSMGESLKQGLGVDRVSVAWHFFCAALLAALAVSLAGVIGFVGLMVPHIMRALHDSRHRYLVPSSVVVGGIVLMAADTVGRSMAPPYEVPVGVITGILGGVFFISLVLRRRL